MIRRLVLVLLAAAAAVLLPWTSYLERTLPASHRADGWRLAWVGFDLGLLGLLACALWLGQRRHPMASSVMTATAALLVCDAWFDVVLDWGSADVWASVASAVLVEIPLAAVLFVSGRHLLSGGMARHTLTPADARLQSQPSTSQVMDALEGGPVRLADLAAATDLPAPLVAQTLRGLRRSRHVRRRRDGRWVRLPLSLERPTMAGLSPADRRSLDAFYEAKVQQESQLFAWAAQQHLDFADWAKGSRSGMRLTERELARFDREYLDLMLRYSMLHPEPTENTRELAVRWYAFPTPAEHERILAAGRPG